MGWLNDVEWMQAKWESIDKRRFLVDRWGFNRLRSSRSFILTASLSFALSFEEYLRGYESGEILGPYR